jgi:CheY-like chemotaxis protein
MELRLDVLMVDDDHNDLALFGYAVDKTELNIWLQTLTAGQQAIDYLKARGEFNDRALHPLPDLILLDLKMPQVSGFDFLAWRKPSPVYSSIPVAVLSDFHGKDDIKRALEMGANRTFFKPTDFDGWKKLAKAVWDFGTEDTAFLRAKGVRKPGPGT